MGLALGVMAVWQLFIVAWGETSVESSDNGHYRELAKRKSHVSSLSRSLCVLSSPASLHAVIHQRIRRGAMAQHSALLQHRPQQRQRSVDPLRAVEDTALLGRLALGQAAWADGSVSALRFFWEV